AAAAGLAELRDPRAVKPLAEALKTADEAGPFVRALARLPLAEAEPALLEILDDPEGHEKVLDGAVGLAARLGSAKLKARLFEMVTAGESSFIHQAEMTWAAARLMTSEDLPRLEKGRAPAKDAAGKNAAFLLTALGDPEGTRLFVEYVQSADFPWRD